MMCAARKKNGSYCKVAAMKDNDYCHFHAPEQAEARRAAQARGGRATAEKIKRLIPNHLAKDVPDVKLDSPADAKVVLEKVVNWTMKGSISTAVATAVVNALGVFVRLVEATETEKKIKEIEERINEQSKAA